MLLHFHVHTCTWTNGEEGVQISNVQHSKLDSSPLLPATLTVQTFWSKVSVLPTFIPRPGTKCMLMVVRLQYCLHCYQCWFAFCHCETKHTLNAPCYQVLISFLWIYVLNSPWVRQLMPEEKPRAYGCLIDIHGDSIHRQHDFILWSSSQLCKVVLHFAHTLVPH